MSERSVQPRSARAARARSDDRRVLACLRACDGLTTDELELGIIADMFAAAERLGVAIALAAAIAAQGKNPALYLRFDIVCAVAAPIFRRSAAAGGDALSRRGSRGERS